LNGFFYVRSQFADGPMLRTGERLFAGEALKPLVALSVFAESTGLLRASGAQHSDPPFVALANR
jgi:hypothetical protein